MDFENADLAETRQLLEAPIWKTHELAEEGKKTKKCAVSLGIEVNESTRKLFRSVAFLILAYVSIVLAVNFVKGQTAIEEAAPIADVRTVTLKDAGAIWLMCCFVARLLNRD